MLGLGKCLETNNNKDPSHSLDPLPTAAAFTQSVGKLLFPLFPSSSLPSLSPTISPTFSRLILFPRLLPLISPTIFPHFLQIHPLSPPSSPYPPLFPSLPPPSLPYPPIPPLTTVCLLLQIVFHNINSCNTHEHQRLLNISSFINLLRFLSQPLKIFRGPLLVSFCSSENLLFVQICFFSFLRIFRDPQLVC